MKTDQVFEVTLCATYPPQSRKAERRMDGPCLPAILIRFLKVQIFNIGCPREMKVLMLEIEFALS
jgi:hypothetical protein